MGDELIAADGGNGRDKFKYLRGHLGSPIRLLGKVEGDAPLVYDEFGVPEVDARYKLVK